MSDTIHFGFLLLPNFSMISFSGAIEVLRMANYISNQELFRWSIITSSGEAVQASNGIRIPPNASLDSMEPMEILFVCGGIKIREAIDHKLLNLLGQLARKKQVLGGICTGSYALIKAGLMNGHQCSIHWENMSAIREEFPHVPVSHGIYSVTPERVSCSGGIVPIDLMLFFITKRFGKKLALQISQQFMLDEIRESHEQQHTPAVTRLGFTRKELSTVAQLMEAHIEHPLSFEVIAQKVGLSQRQLQRMFKHYLGISPSRYYLDLRLQRARQLLMQTNMSIMSITVACGFQSSCHFSKTYRQHFGHAPSTVRR